MLVTGVLRVTPCVSRNSPRSPVQRYDTLACLPIPVLVPVQYWYEVPRECMEVPRGYMERATVMTGAYLVPGSINAPRVVKEAASTSAWGLTSRTPGQNSCTMTADQAYRALGLDRGASLSRIRQSYLRLSIRHHPDKQGSAAAGGDAAFSEINRAYETLKSHPLAQIDRDNAEHEAAFIAEMQRMEAELAQLQSDWLARQAQLSEQLHQGWEARKRSAEQSYKSHHLTELIKQKAHQTPPGIMIEKCGAEDVPKMLFLQRAARGFFSPHGRWVTRDEAGGLEWVAEDQSTINFDKGQQTWILKIADKEGFYALFHSPGPHCCAVQGKLVWADWWYFESVSGRGRRTSLRSRGAFSKELAELAERAEEERRVREEREKREEEQREKEAARVKLRQLEEKRRAYRARLAARPTPAVLRLEYNVGVGSRLVTEAVHTRQLAAVETRTRRLHALWATGKDSHEVREELVRLRCALHFKVRWAPPEPLMDL